MKSPDPPSKSHSWVLDLSAKAMISIVAFLAISACLFYLCRYIWQRAIYDRPNQYANFPQLASSLACGHIPVVWDFMRKNTKNIHFDHLLQTIHERLGKPPVFLMDMRPLSQPICIVCNHEVAEQISKSSKTFPYSVPKSPTAQFVNYITGPRSVLLAENEEWRSLRRQFNPGFSRQYLAGLTSCILEKTSLFIDQLDNQASTGKVFSLDSLCSNLTFDIIGAVAMDIDMDAQLGESKANPIVRAFRELRNTYNFCNGIWAFLPTFQKWSLTHHLDGLMKEVIKNTFDEQRKNPQKGSRSVLSLSLAGQNDLTKEMLDSICDQLKTFLFAGHDTTSALLQWAIYELSRNPRVLASVRREIDKAFGPQSSQRSVQDQIVHSRATFSNKMPYTSAVIKEILRLYPPAASGRYAPPKSGFSIQLPSGEGLAVDGTVLYHCHSIIHRDNTVYGEDATEFVPERWLRGPETNNSIPSSAWRPFERGPRNCMGQELVNIEALAILACTARRYDWEKVGLGATKCDNAGICIEKAPGHYEVKSKLYNTMEISSKPVDGMRMRVKKVGE